MVRFCVVVETVRNPARVALTGALVLSGLGVLALYVLALWLAPEFLINQDLLAKAVPEQRLSAEHNARLIVISIGGALVVGAGLLYTARNYRLAHRGQVTDRFTKALERLGSDELYVRIGGVRALEHVMRDSPEHHVDVEEVLVAFIRNRVPHTVTDTESVEQTRWIHPPAGTEKPELLDEPEADVQAALTALGKRPLHARNERGALNLRQLHLQGAQLDGAHLQHADMRGANLQHASLMGASLKHARLDGTNLRNANLIRADLQRAVLTKADFQHADLGWADLQRAVLDRAKLQHTDLRGANLRNARLSSANLQRAISNKANFQHASLSLANFEGAYLLAANFQQADLSLANLKRANLCWANLQRADLSSSDLRSADLGSANLEGANLGSANLQRANLRGANLQHVNLSLTTVAAEQLARADLSPAAHLPDGITHSALGEIREKNLS